jgi:hypothetical protein
MKLAGKLLDACVSDGINIEIEDCTDAKEAYDACLRSRNCAQSPG